MSNEISSSFITTDIKIELDLDENIEAQFGPTDQDFNEMTNGQINVNPHNTIQNNDVDIKGTIIFNSGMIDSVSSSTCCDTCGEDFDIYCTKCFMLSHILDTCVSLTVTDRARKTLPKNILGFEQTFCGFGVFALKTIPKNVIFGPMDGLDTIANIKTSTWKVKAGKLVVSPEKFNLSNWMQFVNSANHANERNLNIFQYKNCLYYRSEREINEGEELLVYFGDKHVKNKDNDFIIPFIPDIDSTTYDIFVCTLCCLGFSSKAHLLKHKTVCPNGTDTGCSLNEIVQCTYCQIYLDKEEHIEHHKDYCCEKYNGEVEIRRKSRSKAVQDGGSNDDVIVIDSFHCQICSRTFSCRKYLKKHIKNRHTLGEKKYTCSKCSFTTKYKDSIEKHFASVHSDTKPFECPKCPYKSKTASQLRRHLRTHDEVKPFVCDLCGAGYIRKEALTMHMKTKHSADIAMRYKCTDCPFETNRRSYLRNHRYKHLDVKPFTCNLCNSGFTAKATFNKHVKDKHAGNDNGTYKCEKCEYSTVNVTRLKQHMLQHGGVKPFLCFKCGKEFITQMGIDLHEKDKHNESGEMDFNCAKCDYRTNRKFNMMKHMAVHSRVTPLLCKICNKEFTTKRALKMHNKNKHAADDDTDEDSSD